MSGKVRLLLVGGLLAAWAAGAGAQAMYKCGPGQYSDKPCSGGRVVGAKPPKRLDKHAVPPQDRAKAARRGQLPAAAREECETLDLKLVEQQAALDALPQPATPTDERELLQTRQRFRKLHC